MFNEIDQEEDRKLIFVTNYDETALTEHENKLDVDEDKLVVKRIRTAIKHGKTIKWPRDDGKEGSRCWGSNKVKDKETFYKQLFLTLPNKTEANDENDGAVDNNVQGQGNPQLNYNRGAQDRNVSNESGEPLLSSTGSEHANGYAAGASLFDNINEGIYNWIFDNVGFSPLSVCVSVYGFSSEYMGEIV